MSFKKTILAAGLLATTTFASAAPITGVIGFTGIANDNGTTIQFSNVVTNVGTGTYAGLGGGLSVTMNDLTYSPLFSLTNPLWSFIDSGITYEFELTGLSTASLPGDPDLSGLGTLKATGFTDTAGIWQYSSQIGFTFSAGSAPVSEPATLALLGLGLAGLGFARRKQAKAA